MLDKSTAYGIYLAYVDDYLKELGEDGAAIFRAAGVAAPSALPLQERIEVETLAEVICGVNRQVRRSSFFLELGARIPLMAHGNLGSAIMACKDARTVMQVTERYAAIVLPAVRILLRQEGEEAVVEYHVSTHFSESNIALLEALISTTTYNLSLLTDRPFYPHKVRVAFARPPHWERYRQFTRCEVEFDADANRMYFADTQLDWPLRTANALNQRVMLAQCDDELEQVQSRTQLAARIREIVSLHLATSPSIGFVAAKLRMSERTLRRRLNEEGLNYRDVLKQLRHESALHFLEKTNVRIDSIAQQLGYRETANFRKAFKEQCGQSPRQWRDAARAGGTPERKRRA